MSCFRFSLCSRHWGEKAPVRSWRCPIDTALSETLTASITDYLLWLLEIFMDSQNKVLNVKTVCHNVSAKEAFQALCFGMH